MRKDRKKEVVIAVDIGATNLRTSLVDAVGTVHKKHVYSTPKKGDRGEDMTDFIIFCISGLLGELSTTESESFEIVSIGVSVAGPITPDRKGYIPTNVSFGNVPIVLPLTKKYDLPVEILNDTKAAVYAEWKVGHGKNRGGLGEVRNMCYITMSTGISGGVITQGQLALGRDGSFGHVGQISVESPVGYGDHDWESYMGGINILGFYNTWSLVHGDDPQSYESVPALFDAVESDPNLQDFMQVLSSINGQGLSNVIHAYNPEMIVIGGGVARNNWEILIKGLGKFIRKDIISETPGIVRTDLGDDISCIGVALYAFSRL